MDVKSILLNTRDKMKKLYEKEKTIKQKKKSTRYYPVHFDPKFTDYSRKMTPLADLIPRVRKTISKYEQVKNKTIKWFNNKRLRLAYWIGGKTLEDAKYADNY